MKRIYPVFLLLIFCGMGIQVFPQTYIGGTLIHGIPSGLYGSKTNLGNGGFADPGYSLGIKLTHFFKKNLGYGFGFDAGNNAVDEESMKEEFLKQGLEIEDIGSFDYEVINFLGSFIAKTKVSHHIEAQASVNGGFMSMTFPAQSITFKQDSVNNRKVVLFGEGEEGSALVIGMEAGFSYLLNRFKVYLYCDFLYGIPRFDYYDPYEGIYKIYRQETALIRPGLQLNYEL